MGWDKSLIHARKYIEYVDSIKEIHYAKSKVIKGIVEKTDYYYDKISDTLQNLIARNLYGKIYPQSFDENPPGTVQIYDGYNFYIIYKFEKEPEHIINYLPHTLPDSLKGFLKYVENLAKRSTFKSYKKFDNEGFIMKYKKTFTASGHLAPPPEPLSE